LEDHKNAIYLFNSRKGALKQTIVTDSAPIAIESVLDRDKETIVTSAADMTLSTYVLDDPNPKRRYSVLSSWGTPGVQMALAYARDSRILYSGATNGNIYAWDVGQRNMVSQMAGGHSDIVMSLIVLNRLDNIASASLDKTLGIWDSHTNQEILRLHGHRKGVFDVAYNPTYRLMFSCGFEHDACVWSPFVKSLVFRLKGHHASLVGVQCVENTPELITADTSGIFKLWDVRNFQCVQTFTMNAASLGEGGGHGTMKLNSFFHTKLPSTNPFQKEDDSRVYAASKMLFSFDQARVVHEATTDYTNIHFVAWIDTASTIITASERNVIVWDALMGSKMYTHTDICEDEISACCLDDRRRKIVIGEITGAIGVYNSSNGQLMKTVHKPERSVVIALQYYNAGKRFLAGYANGLICVFDENVLEECNLIRCFEEFNRHSEMLALRFCSQNHTVVTAESSSNIARLWSYDSGKCDVELHVGFEEDNSIVAVAVLDPYPIVVTSDTTGNIIFWGSRGIRWQGLRITGFLNQHPPYCQQEIRERPLRSDEDGKQKNSAGSNNIDEDDDAHNVTQYLRVWPPQELREQDPDADLDRVLQKQIARQMSTLENQKSPPTRIRGLRASFNPLAEAFQVDPYIAATSKLTAEDLYRQAEEKWGKISPAQSISFAREEKLLFVGDDAGHIRCYDIRDVLEDIKAEKLLEEPLYCNRILGLCRAKKRTELAALPPIPDEFEFHHHLNSTGNLGSMRGSMMNSSFAANNATAITQLIQQAAAARESNNTSGGGRLSPPNSAMMRKQQSTIGLLNRAPSTVPTSASAGVGGQGNRPGTAGSRPGTANTQDSNRNARGSISASKADEFDFHASLYLLGQPGNAMSYLGVKFRWGLSAHTDRIMTITVISGRGILTSAADRIVKMWSMEGEYLGNLLQSVPIGVRSRSWDLTLDVDKIIEKEQEELNEIIEQAKAVAADPDKPDIRTMNFSGMELGAESAGFSQSMLRQRIDKTAKILGLDFPDRGVKQQANYDDKSGDDHHTEDKAKKSKSKKDKKAKIEDEEDSRISGDDPRRGQALLIRSASSQQLDEGTVSLQSSIDMIDGLSSIISAAAHSQTSNNNSYSHHHSHSQDGNNKGDTHSLVSGNSSKSHLDALREIKSTDSAVDYDLKNRSMSYLQQRRKATKMAVIARTFEEKTEERSGIPVNLKVGKLGPPSAFGASAHNPSGIAADSDDGEHGDHGQGDQQQNNDNIGGHVSEEYMQLTRDDASANSAMYSLDTMSKHGKREMQRQQRQQPQTSSSSPPSPASKSNKSTTLIQGGQNQISLRIQINPNPPSVSFPSPNAGVVPQRQPLIAGQQQSHQTQKSATSNNSNSRTGSPSSHQAGGDAITSSAPPAAGVNTENRRASHISALSSASSAAPSHSRHSPQQQQDHNRPVPITGSPKQATSKLKESIQAIHEKGPRTVSMMKSCRKYSAFAALEEAIHAPVSVGRVSQRVSHEELTKLRAEREKKHIDLLNDIVPTIPSSIGMSSGGAGGVPSTQPTGATGGRVRRVDSLFHSKDILQFGEEVMYQQQQKAGGRRSSLTLNGTRPGTGGSDLLTFHQQIQQQQPPSMAKLSALHAPAIAMTLAPSGSSASSQAQDDLSVNSEDILTHRSHDTNSFHPAAHNYNLKDEQAHLRRDLSMASRSMDGTDANSVDDNLN
jgi:hypothetical protein